MTFTTEQACQLWRAWTPEIEEQTRKLVKQASTEEIEEVFRRMVTERICTNAEIRGLSICCEEANARRQSS